MYYHNSQTGEIEEYTEAEAGYELKGVIRAYGDAVTIGFKTKEKAIEWAKKWGYCPKCESSASGKNNKCFRCETNIIFKKLKS